MPSSDCKVYDLIYSQLAQSDNDFAEIVQLFVDGLVHRLQSMQEAFEKDDLGRLRRLAHQLKGSGGGHGYPILTEKAAELEQQVISGEINEIKTGLAELADLIAHVQVLPEP